MMNNLNKSKNFGLFIWKKKIDEDRKNELEATLRNKNRKNKTAVNTLSGADILKNTINNHNRPLKKIAFNRLLDD